MSTKMSVNISDDARDFLIEDCKEKRGGTVTDHIHRAISLLKFVYDSQKNGDDIFIRKADGSEHKIQFLW